MPSLENQAKPRGLGRWRPIFVCLAILFIPFLFAFYLAAAPRLALPIRVHVAGLPRDLEKNFTVLLTDEHNGTWTSGRVLTTSYWAAKGTWIRDIAVGMPYAALPILHELTITIGDKAFVYSGAEVRGWPQPEQVSVARRRSGAPEVVLLAPIPPRRSTIPILKRWAWFQNWPGDAAYLRAVAQYSFIPILIVLFINYWFKTAQTPEGRRWSRAVLGLEHLFASNAGEAAASAARPWDVLGLTFLVAALVLLELMSPYYFTQSDTLSESMPAILVGCRSMWRGEFPDYNPYLMCGEPLASTGIYSLTYPPLYLCYAIARHVLGQEFMTMEVFAILHLLAGFLAMRLLARRLGMGALPANFAALSFILSGSLLIMGRSWHNFLPLAVWLPVLFLGLVWLCTERVGWKWILGMALALAMPMHVGFAQLAIYLDGFFCLGVGYLLLSGELPRRQLPAVLAALLLGAALSLPLVYQQMLLAQSTSRGPSAGAGIAADLPALLLPYPLAQGQLDYPGWCNENLPYIGHLYFFGGLLAFLFLFQIVGLGLFRLGKGVPEPANSSAPIMPPRNRLSGHVWAALAVLAIWLGLGDVGGLWTLTTWLPVIGFINRYPLRLTPFIVFFACIVGGLVLERLLRSSARRGRAEMILALGFSLVLVLHLGQCRTSFHSFKYRPYPALTEDMRHLFWNDGQVTGRVSNWSTYSDNEIYGLLMGQNLAAVYELPTAQSVNPVVEGTPQGRFINAAILEKPLATFRAFGVRWLLAQSESHLTPVGSNLSNTWLIEAPAKSEICGEKLKRADLALAHEADGLIIYELPGADPLAFTMDPVGDASGPRLPPRSLPLHMHGGGLNVDVSSLANNQLVVVGFLRYAADVMYAQIDGQAAPLQTDPWGRIAVQVPAGNKLLAIRYSPPWRQGFIWGLIPGILGLGLAWQYRRRSRFDLERKIA